MKQYVSTLSLIMASSLLLSCGKDSGGGGSSSTQELHAGSYRAVLHTVNSSIAGNGAFGTAVIKKNGEDMEIKVHVIDAHANISHQQYIFSGGQCPNAEADINGDSVVDSLEGENFFGSPLIALDGDLSSQDPEGSSFPRANSAGNYSYTQEASFSGLKNEVENFGLSGRTFVVHGVRKSALPPTLGTREGMPVEETVPVACGTLIPIPVE